MDYAPSLLENILEWVFYPPCSALADAPVMLSLLVVQFIVAGVSAAGSSRDHGSWLGVGEPRCCVVPRTRHHKKDKDRTGYYMCKESVTASEKLKEMKESLVMTLNAMWRNKLLLEWKGRLLMHINRGPFPFITSSIKTPRDDRKSHTKS